ncbi:MAG: LD-carboxypeptidase [Herpetosiphonaceae bacterium]|nr:MAG: LD-carboxypeptidase [Herpetosiphonaceae bacterium]
MIPVKLKPGDEIRVVSPATSLAFIAQDQRQIAIERFARLGFTITFSEHAEERDMFDSSSVASRIHDLHAAFSDPSVKGILTTIGGYNSNQLLRYLDFELIGAHPKVFCGYSDITALSVAIYARTGLVTYSGPHFSTFAMRRGLDYTVEYFKKCLMEEAPFAVDPAETWSDDAWYLDQEKREFIPNEGYLIINEGYAEGTLLGGNLSTFVLLHGTEYMPDLRNSILLLEEDCEAKVAHFDRQLQALIHQPGFAGVKGLIIGRFQKASKISDEMLVQVIKSKQELAEIPVIANASFGHTTPQFTFPVGGRGTLAVDKGRVEFVITAH